jgi:hypothetical protein
MPRLNKEREERLQPKRMAKAIKEIEEKGYKVTIISDTEISFTIDNITKNKVNYFPYSGWATGKDIKDGRGLKKLLNQI